MGSSEGSLARKGHDKIGTEEITLVQCINGLEGTGPGAQRPVWQLLYRLDYDHNSEHKKEWADWREIEETGGTNLVVDWTWGGVDKEVQE